MAVSPDGRWLVSTHADGATWASSLPNLKPVRRLLPAHRDYRQPVDSISFSPDSKRVAIANRRETPHLFETATWRECSPGPGHFGRMRGIYFAPDGKTLRTGGSDGTVCQWDAATLRMLRRVHLPEADELASFRPSDGRYVAVHSRTEGLGALLKIVDCDNGKVLAEVPVAKEEGTPSVFWRGDAEAMYATRQRVCRFDLRTGIVRGEHLAMGEEGFAGANERHLSEDGETLYLLGGDGLHGREGKFAAEEVQVVSGHRRALANLNLPRFSGAVRGLVPGGRFCYLARPGLHIFERQTLRPVLSREFRSIELSGISFSADGRRFAIGTRAEGTADRQLHAHDPERQALVRVHDTATGKTLAAFFASSLKVEVKISPDGKRVAVINEDDTLELWDLAS